MKFVLKNIKIHDKNSQFNNKVVDILFEKNNIIQIGNVNEKDCKLYNCKDLSISIGWFDLRSFIGEPGFEEREDAQSFVNAAFNGGYTSAAILPNTNPILEFSENITALINKGKNLNFSFHPIAALSKQTEGNELTEILDLSANGAVCFSDGLKPIDNSELLLKSLIYSKQNKCLIINIPQDKYLRKRGFVREGENSMCMGLHGIPSISETLMIQRDLEILEYTKGRLHFSCVTTAKGLQLIQKAKQNGLNVTCDIAAHYLAFDDSSCLSLNENLKVFPPFATKSDIKAIRKALENGTIDCIVSDHQPVNIEEKCKEFDKAMFGISSIETTFSTIKTYSELSIDEILNKICYNPREILKIQTPTININERGCYTVFNENEKYTLTLDMIKSKSKNSPFINQELVGKVKFVINEKGIIES